MQPPLITGGALRNREKQCKGEIGFSEAERRFFQERPCKQAEAFRKEAEVGQLIMIRYIVGAKICAPPDRSEI